MAGRGPRDGTPNRAQRLNARPERAAVRQRLGHALEAGVAPERPRRLAESPAPGGGRRRRRGGSEIISVSSSNAAVETRRAPGATAAAAAAAAGVMAVVVVAAAAEVVAGVPDVATRPPALVLGRDLHDVDPRGRGGGRRFPAARAPGVVRFGRGRDGGLRVRTAVFVATLSTIRLSERRSGGGGGDRVSASASASLSLASFFLMRAEHLFDRRKFSIMCARNGGLCTPLSPSPQELPR